MPSSFLSDESIMFQLRDLKSTDRAFNIVSLPSKYQRMKMTIKNPKDENFIYKFHLKVYDHTYITKERKGIPKNTES